MIRSGWLRAPAQSPQGGGGVDLTVSTLSIDSTATGVVAQLASGLPGVLTFSRLSGANVTVAAGGAVSFATVLAAGETRTLAARVQNADGRAIERSFTFTGQEAGAGTVDFTLSNASVVTSWGVNTVGFLTAINAPAGAYFELRDENAGFALVEG